MVPGSSQLIVQFDIESWQDNLAVSVPSPADDTITSIGSDSLFPVTVILILSHESEPIQLIYKSR